MQALLVIFAIVFSSTRSNATSCAHRPYYNELDNWAEYVFSGKVIERDPPLLNLSLNCAEKSGSDYIKCENKKIQGLCGDKVAAIEVLEVIRGNLKGQVKVTSIDGCMGPGAYLKVGDELLIYAQTYKGSKGADLMLDGPGCRRDFPLKGRKIDEVIKEIVAEDEQLKKGISKKELETLKKRRAQTLSPRIRPANYELKQLFLDKKKSKEECAKIGGDMKNIDQGCYLPAKDAGKECSDVGECAVDCIAELSEVEKQTLKKASLTGKNGSCAKFVLECGARIRHGEITENSNFCYTSENPF